VEPLSLSEPFAEVDRQLIVDVFAHPLRARILTALSERPGTTVRAVAERLGVPASRVRPQIEALVDLGLAEVTGEEIVGGVLRRRYGAGPTRIPAANPEDAGMMIEVGKVIVRMVMESIAVAASAGTLSRRPDDFEVRMYGEVDEACLEQLRDLHQRAYDDIFDAIEAGRERVRESGEPGTEIVSALFFFEAPLWGPRPPRRSGKRVPRPGSGLLGSVDQLPRSAEDPSIYLDPHAMSKAYGHPVRGRVLTALAERPDVTIREVADHLGEPPRRVRHHVQALQRMGLVSVTSSENLSGVVQHRYGTGPLIVDDVEAWSREERMRFALATVHLLAADFGVAAKSGNIGKSDDDFEIRQYGEVDDACLEELAAIHGRAYRAIRAAVYEGRERVWRSGEPGTEIVSALFFFEAPLWAHVAAR
jgi:DNA-binding transcriptional ArsR family regulator